MVQNLAKAPPIAMKDYQERLMQLWMFAGAIERLPIEDMLAAAKTADSIALITDPTLYRDKGPALKQDIEMMEALQHVQVRMRKFRDDMEAHVAKARPAAGMTADAKTDNGN